MKRSYYIVLINCDCASDVIARRTDQFCKYLFGPRCPGCQKILGWMQWRLACEKVFRAEGEMEALQKYREFTDNNPIQSIPKVGG